MRKALAAIVVVALAVTTAAAPLRPHLALLRGAEALLARMREAGTLWRALRPHTPERLKAPGPETAERSAASGPDGRVPCPPPAGERLR